VDNLWTKIQKKVIHKVFHRVIHKSNPYKIRLKVSYPQFNKNQYPQCGKMFPQPCGNCGKLVKRCQKISKKGKKLSEFRKIHKF